MRRQLGWIGVASATVTASTVLATRPAAAVSCPAWSPTCQAVSDAVGGVVGSVTGGVADTVADTVLGTLASGFLEAYLLMFRWATTWWLSFTMSPAALAGTVDSSLTGLIAYLASFVLVVALLSASITTMWRRDGAVLADTAAGVFKAIVVITAGWAGLGVLWKLADQITSAVAPSPANITIDPALGQAVAAGGPGIAVLVLLLSAIGFVLSLGMALMMVFRVASVVVLGLMLPIAAAGSPGTTTRGWLPKVLGWLLALILLRPMVAAIYRIGFEFTAGGNDGDAAVVAALNGTGRSLPASAADGLLTLVVGMMTLLVAMLALPVLLKLFTWMFGGGPTGGGAGLALASLGANGAILARGLHPGGTALSDEPTGATATGGPGGSGGSGGYSPTTTPGSPSGPSASGGGSAASSAATASGGTGASVGAASAGAGGAAGGAGAAAAAGGPVGMAAAAGVMAIGAAAGQARQAVVSSAQGPEDHGRCVVSAEPVRTYGGWRERKGFGVAGLDGRRTAALMAGMVVVLLIGMTTTAGMLIALPLAAAVGAGVLGRWRGETLLDLAGRHLAYRRADRRGWAAHRAGLGRPAGGEWTLPGPLAGTALLTAEDEQARPWAVVWHRRTGALTATWLVSASSTALVDPAQADGWVANWHVWLAALGYAPTVRHVTVTVESTPASPTTLAAAVNPRLDPAAPLAARALMADLIAAAPAAADAVTTRVSVTLDPRRGQLGSAALEEQVAEFSRMLTGLATSLTGCGVTVLRRATIADHVGWGRGAFDPASRDALAGPLPANVGWADAGPVAADEAWDHYRADSGTSVSYGWDEAPRQAVTADVLGRLIGPGRWPKRVTLVLTPSPAAAAARELDLQAQAAVFRSQVKRKSGRDETARDHSDRQLAARAAAEEANGAGLVSIQAYATVTTRDPADLPAAATDLEHRAEESRIRLRRLYGSQAVGFTVGLSCGITPELLRSRR